MKWIAALGLGLLLVLICVVYLRREPAPPPRLAPPVSPLAVKPKVRPLPAQPKGPPSPVDISGPLKDRGLVSWVLPVYPEWAQEKGISGISRMKIWVTPEGRVRTFLEAQQLSADPRLDEEAVQALKQWTFEKKDNSFGDQWGIVTVRFALLSSEEGTGASVEGVSLGQQRISGAWECIRKWVGDAKDHFVYICRLKKPVIQ